ncbi:hypothetical protein F5X68DRAFT_208126, partial [Plectosphaerella plurivora]
MFWHLSSRALLWTSHDAAARVGGVGRRVRGSSTALASRLGLCLGPRSADWANVVLAPPGDSRLIVQSASLAPRAAASCLLCMHCSSRLTESQGQA